MSKTCNIMVSGNVKKIDVVGWCDELNWSHKDIWEFCMPFLRGCIALNYLSFKGINLANGMVLNLNSFVCCP